MALKLDKDAEDGTYSYFHKSEHLKFDYRKKWEDMADYVYYEVDNIRLVDGMGNIGGVKKFNSTDFYEILLLNAKKYREVGGFD